VALAQTRFTPPFEWGWRAVRLCSSCLWWWGRLCRRCAAGGCARAVLVVGRCLSGVNIVGVCSVWVLCVSPPVVGPLRGPPLCVGPLWMGSSPVVFLFPVASLPRLASRSRSRSRSNMASFVAGYWHAAPRRSHNPPAQRLVARSARRQRTCGETRRPRLYFALPPFPDRAAPCHYSPPSRASSEGVNTHREEDR